MPRRKMTDDEKALISKRMKARWKRARQEPSANGTRVEQRIVLHLNGEPHDLTLAEATALRDALNAIVTANIDSFLRAPEPAHD